MINISTNHGRGTTHRVRVLLSCLLLAWVPASSFAKGPKPLPRRTQKGDIQIWDDQYLGGRPPKGGKASGGFLEVFGRYDPMNNVFRSGRFGLFSGSRVHTTFRFIKPMTDEIYAEGKTTIFDNHVSELVTSPFEVKLGYVTFLLSGGNMPNEACINLLIDGKVVRTATGRNDDTLEWVAFDVKAFKGQQAQIQVLDTSIAAFGYITFDCVYQSVDPKGATRVIAQPPAEAKGAGSVTTASGTTNGKVELAGGALTIAKQPLDLGSIIELDTGVEAKASDAGRRVQLINGDLLAGDITGLKDDQLNFAQPTLGPLGLKLDDVAQAIFMPGPTVQAKPGTLIQINNRKIPGKLKWIREDNIAINCALGLVPLPRTRVRSFVFAETKPASGASNRVVLTDGSVLSGKLAVNDQGLILKHSLLGDLTLDLKRVARITRHQSNVLNLTELQGKLVKRVGPIPPPAPAVISSASGPALRMFPGTVTRYTLPASKQPRRFRAELTPLPGTKAGVMVTVRVNGKATNFSIDPGADAHAVDLDLGTATVLEIQVQVDASQAIVFPSGIDWRNTLIMESNTL